MRNPAYSKMSLDENQKRQFLVEIQWLKDKIEEIKPLLERKPSKIKHIRDLERQIEEREKIVEKSVDKS